VKAPKVYIVDSGLLHGLLNLPRQADIEGHLKVSASWKGFVIEQIATHLRAEPEECCYWATHTGAELDLLIVMGNERRAFEIKRTSSPGATPSMQSVLSDLSLARLDVIHAGDRTFDLAPRIRSVSLSRLLSDIRPLEPPRAGRSRPPEDAPKPPRYRGEVESDGLKLVDLVGPCR
jgi:predicted AAA+ superfamily ATPase